MRKKNAKAKFKKLVRARQKYLTIYVHGHKRKGKWVKPHYRKGKKIRKKR